MRKETTYKLQGDGRDSWIVKVYDDNNELVDTYMTYERNWRGLTESLYGSQLFYKAMTSANPNAYSTILKVLSDGENGNSTQNTFLSVFNMLGVNWSEEEKTQLNTVLSDNLFTIQIL
jgi:hypothetical protein